jgi:hypothetical protein
VRIVVGSTARSKVVEIDGARPDTLTELLAGPV